MQTEPRTKGKAVASLVCGLVALACFFALQLLFRMLPSDTSWVGMLLLALTLLAIICLLLVLVLGPWAWLQSRRQADRRGQNLAVGGVFSGSLAFLLFSLIPMPSHVDRWPQASAVGGLRSISAANVNYHGLYGQYAATLAQLGPPPEGQIPSQNAADLIDAYLARGQKQGYAFRYFAEDRNGDGQLDAFRAHADPNIPGETSLRHFFVDETGVIRVETERPADKNSRPIP